MSTRRDVSELASWHASWSGLRVGVLGLGVTGFSVADTLAELGANVMVVAAAADELRVKMLEVIGGELVYEKTAQPVPHELAEFDPELIVVSPGYRPTHPIVLWAEEKDIPIWGDIDLAWRVRDKVRVSPWLAVTGTNGKTTTVQLASAMLTEAGLRVAPCGNLGVPVLDAVRDPQGFDVYVVELSSFQLHWMRDVHPYASVVVNVAEDHLDWHGSFEEYAHAKSRIYHNTEIACVYNKADPLIQRMVEDADVVEGARAIGFDLGAPGPSDFGVVDGVLCDRAFVEDRHNTAQEITTVEELTRVGLGSAHMVQNILAASALVRSLGISSRYIHQALEKFTVDSHRHEVITISGDVTWINDSKATNPHAADASLSAHESIVWIVGGLLKGVSIDQLVKKHEHRLRAAIVIGQEQDPVISAFTRHASHVPVVRVLPADTSDVMVEAVKAALGVAQPGDVVLLAPAAASMDQFADYAQRGKLFAHAVINTLGGEADDSSASQ